MIKKELQDCPVATTVGLVSNKWKAFIIHELMGGKKRFNELRRKIIGISQKALTDNLRAMERDGLLTRTVFPEVPLRVEYELSELGRSLTTVMQSVIEWGEYYQKLIRDRKIVNKTFIVQAAKK